MSERRAYRLSGRVQGVGFRWWARQTAVGLGLRGVVRNDPDGAVWVEAEGDVAGMDQFEALLHTGPSGARVQQVTAVPVTDRPLPTRFEISR
jgi:acylphosphatase